MRIGNDSRSLLRRTNELLRENPDLAVEYNLMRNQARKLRIAGSYDITSRCNLWCEGCYYFSGDQHALRDETDLQRWKDHFRAERDRGVTFAYIAGAEPAMEQERLFAVHDNIPNGTVASNGTIMIDKAITYRIIVSVWGDADLTKELRGGSTFWKALRLYGGDERALFAYTITKQNIRQLPKVLDILSKEGVEVAFNMYSPTIQYLKKLQTADKNDKEFFRVSNAEHNLCFTDDDLSECRDVVDRLIEEYPDTVVYPHACNREVTASAPLYDLDPETGIATNCAGRHADLRTYLSTLELSDRKCCMPNMDCSQCRALTAFLPSRLMPRPADLANRASFIDWIEICQFWTWFYLGRENRLTMQQFRTAPQSAARAI